MTMPTLRSFLFATLVCVSGPALAAGPDPILLWPSGAPDAVGDEPQDKPQLRVYLPTKEVATGAGVVICPGGGYAVLAYDHEGHQVARWFNSQGVAAFVLQYRLGPRYHHPAPLQDVQRALRHVRARAEEYGVSSRRIGVMGFSAGGHLASTAATHFDAGSPQNPDVIERVSCRPDFVVLGYPVVSLNQSFSHGGSRRNLLGENPSPELVASLSNETQVTKETPPAFLFHTGEDAGVPVNNSIVFYQACHRAGVPAELHIYQFGPHGVGLGAGDPVLATWKERLADWLQTSGLLADVERAAVEGQVTVGGKPLRWGMISFTHADSPRAPVAFAMISGGKYSVPASRGAVVGKCRVTVHDLGAVEPRPTIEDARQLDGGAAEIRSSTQSRKNDPQSSDPAPNVVNVMIDP